MACQFFLFKNYIKNVKGFNQVGNSSPSNSILRIHFLQFRKQIWKAIWEQRCFEVPWIRYQDFDIRKNWLTTYSWHIHPAVFFCEESEKVWFLSVWKLFLVSILSVCKHSSHTLIKVFSNYNNFADATFDWNQNVSVEKDFWIKKVTNTPTIDPCILAYQEWNSPARMLAIVEGTSIRFDKQMG